MYKQKKLCTFVIFRQRIKIKDAIEVILRICLIKEKRIKEMYEYI